MSRVLTTFSGKFGDILWSMPTVRAIAEITGGKVDFACMPQYEGMLPLLRQQPYIDAAFVLRDWIMLHSNYGDQPWNPPGHSSCLGNEDHRCMSIRQGYEYCYHLGYRQHPGQVMGGKEMQLIEFIAWQQGITFKENPLPFLTPAALYDANRVKGLDWTRPFLAYGFNDQYVELKDRFMQILRASLPGEQMVDTTKLGWMDAALVIKKAVGYFGCRSANHVIAHGVGQQRLFVYEPHPARHRDGHLGYVFGCSYGREVTSIISATPEWAAEAGASVLKHWIKEAMEEQTNETAEAKSR